VISFMDLDVERSRRSTPDNIFQPQGHEDTTLLLRAPLCFSVIAAKKIILTN
jgi:hypothetical protein